MLIIGEKKVDVAFGGDSFVIVDIEQIGLEIKIVKPGD